MIRVRIKVSFRGWRINEEDDVPDSALTRAYISAGYMEVIGDGTDTGGPGGPAPGDPGSLAAGADERGTPGGESGEGFGSSGYGAAESSDRTG